MQSNQVFDGGQGRSFTGAACCCRCFAIFRFGRRCRRNRRDLEELRSCCVFHAVVVSSSSCCSCCDSLAVVNSCRTVVFDGSFVDDKVGPPAFSTVLFGDHLDLGVNRAGDNASRILVTRIVVAAAAVVAAGDRRGSEEPRASTDFAVNFGVLFAWRRLVVVVLPFDGIFFVFCVSFHFFFFVRKSGAVVDGAKHQIRSLDSEFEAFPAPARLLLLLFRRQQADDFTPRVLPRFAAIRLGQFGGRRTPLLLFAGQNGKVKDFVDRFRLDRFEKVAAPALAGFLHFGRALRHQRQERGLTFQRDVIIDICDVIVRFGDVFSRRRRMNPFGRQSRLYTRLDLIVVVCFSSDVIIDICDVIVRFCNVFRLTVSGPFVNFLCFFRVAAVKGECFVVSGGVFWHGGSGGWPREDSVDRGLHDDGLFVVVKAIFKVVFVLFVVQDLEETRFLLLGNSLPLVSLFAARFEELNGFLMTLLVTFLVRDVKRNKVQLPDFLGGADGPGSHGRGPPLSLRRLRRRRRQSFRNRILVGLVLFENGLEFHGMRLHETTFVDVVILDGRFRLLFCLAFFRHLSFLAGHSVQNLSSQRPAPGRDSTNVLLGRQVRSINGLDCKLQDRGSQTTKAKSF